MGLYNAIFGENPDKQKLLAILDIDQSNGNWSAGRFRDIYVTVKDGKKVIALYTRNGGGNRTSCWNAYNPDIDDCRCAACSINKHLPKHPNYLFDEDEKIDRTYNNCYFTIPDGADVGEPAEYTPNEKWDNILKKLDNKDANENDPEVKRALKVGKDIFYKIKDL